MSFSNRIRMKFGRSEAETAAPLIAVMGLADRDEAAADQVEVALRRTTRVMPSLAIIYLAAGAILALLGLVRDSHGFTNLGLTAVVPALLVLAGYVALRAKPIARLRPSFRVYIAMGLVIALGASLGASLGVEFMDRGPAHWIPRGVIAIAALATFLAVSPLPVLAGIALVVFGGAFLIASNSATYLPEISLLAGALLLMAFALVRSDQAELKRMASTRNKASKASALIAMFEDSGKVWFWESDRFGQLSYVSPNLAAYFGKQPADLIGTMMTGLIVNGGDEDLASPHGERTINFYLSNRLAFNELPVRAALPGEPRWWAVTGRPIIDSVGTFRGFRGSGTDFTEARRSEAEITRLARFDSLTGLPNRALMLQTLEQSLANGRTNHAPCVLMMIDLDRFKIVNDTLGHPTGDQLLKLVAKRLESVVGETGRCGRLGGDEFTVVMPVAPSNAKIQELADQIILHLSQPYTVDESHISIGASVGIALGPLDGETADALLRNADLALYAAKAAGRGAARFYEAAMHSDAQERRTIETDLRRALAENEMHLEYQPVVCASSETIAGFEALLRWTHPTRGSISPSLFIPVAEEIGLIPALGEWAMRTACLQAAKWPSNIRVAVNVSPVQFANPSFPSVVMSALATSQLDPSRLELEITEGVFLNEGLDTDSMFSRLKAIGVRLALDDFGTGYSALGYLRKAPFDKIKIDRSFVAGAAVPGSRNAAIIKAIVSLAESLGMDTTAEGAETMDELALIRSLGCSHIQGYIFGTPMSAAKASERLASSGGSATPEGFEYSRAPRIRMLRSAAIVQGSNRLPVRLRNISSSGAQIEMRHPLPVGSKMTVDLGEGAQISSIVRWVEGDRMGVAFDGSLDVDALTAPRPVVRRRA